jgi:hypothetical protein
MQEEADGLRMMVKNTPIVFTHALRTAKTKHIRLSEIFFLTGEMAHQKGEMESPAKN